MTDNERNKHSKVIKNNNHTKKRKSERKSKESYIHEAEDLIT